MSGWGGNGLGINGLVKDIRFALRQLRQAPGFALTAILTLGAGIAATIVVFSIVNAVLLRPLPFPDADRLMAIDSLRTTPGVASAAPVVDAYVSYPNFYDWRSRVKSFESMTAYQSQGYTLTDHNGGAAQRVAGVMTTSELLTALGVSPELGRGFRLDDEQAGNRSVILSYGLWQSQFGGEANVLGKLLRLNDEDYTVVGVMKRRFQFPADANEGVLWVTQAHNAEGANSSASQRGWSQALTVAKLRAGVTVEQARAEMDTLQRALALEYPDNDKGQTGVQITPLVTELVGGQGKALNILFACVSFLLLIACANVAGLLLTRANRRRGEMSIRAAMGASRVQIIRQLMMESLTLAGLGGMLGLGLAMMALKAAPWYLPAELPRVQSVTLDGPVALFAIGLSLLTGVIFGALPAWRMSTLDPVIALREGARGTTASRGQNRLQSAIVVAETAISLVLLVGAGLLLRSFDRILHVDPGFKPDHMLTFRIAIPQKRFTGEQRGLFFQQLMPRLEAMPGVKAATGAFPLPLTGGNISVGFNVVGQKTGVGEQPSARLSLVQAKFFETLGIPLKQGRFFGPADQRGAAPQVVIVNEAFARRYFPGKSAVGEHLQTDIGVTDAPIREIVGVVRDVKRANLTEASEPEYYVPIEQGPVAPPSVAIRVAGDAASYEPAVRALLAGIDPTLPVYRVHTYEQDLKRITTQQRFEVVLITGFAVIALLLSAVGLYGALGYMVSQRTREIGLRIALGAQREDVRNQFLRQGLVLGVSGLVIGGLVAAVLTRFLTSLLFGVGRFDGVTFAGMTLLLFAVSCVASLAPAYRASRLDPMQALRAE